MSSPLQEALLARLTSDVGHRLRGKLPASRLLNPGLQKVGQGGNRLILAHVLQGRGIAKGALQHIILDTLAFQRGNGFQLLVFFGGDVD